MNPVLIQQCEALIYMSGDEGIEHQTIAMVLLCDLQEVHDMIAFLNERYLQHQSALTIINVASKAKMVTVSEVHEVLTHIFT